MKRTQLLVCCVLAGLAAGCSTVYYGTMEKFGVHKRDMLVDGIKTARDSQAAVAGQFKTTLEHFSDVVDFEGGELEEKYNKLSREFERCEKQAGQVHEHIADVERVSKALFKEWRAELKDYSSKELRRNSEDKLKQTEQRYAQLMGAMKRAESKLEPVLDSFRDQVLFLKHNLNAQAIASLQDELDAVELGVQDLIADMERSIQEADRFIQEMMTAGG